MFNFSLQGADELGGYALAVGSTIAFSLALMGRNHIRVDVFHEKFSAAAAGVAELAVDRLAGARSRSSSPGVAFKVLGDTMQYRQHRADALGDAADLAAERVVRRARVFALVAAGYAARATWLLFTGRIDTLNHDFHPKSAKEELKEELDDLAHVRQGVRARSQAHEDVDDCISLSRSSRCSG